METITKYVSNDGVEFETEKECLAHEKYIEEIPNSIIAFNDDMERLVKTEDLEESAMFVLITDKEEANEYFNYISSEYYMQFPTEEGKWYYDTENDVWSNFDSLVEKTEKIGSMFESFCPVKNG